VQYGAVLGFEPAPLGGCESFVRKFKDGDGVERLTHAPEALFEAGGQRAQRRGPALRGAHDIERSNQELSSLGRAFSHAICADQGQPLPPLEPVVHDRLAQRLLVLGTEATQGVCQRDADLAGIHASLHPR